MHISILPALRAKKPSWNKGRIVGQKRPLRPQQVWAIRTRLEIADNLRDLALFNLAIDSKLRGCDLVSLKVPDVFSSGQVKERTSIIQNKTQKPIKFEITETARNSLDAWIAHPTMHRRIYLFPSRFRESDHICTRQYARMVRKWVKSIGL